MLETAKVMRNYVALSWSSMDMLRGTHRICFKHLLYMSVIVFVFKRSSDSRDFQRMYCIISGESRKFLHIIGGVVICPSITPPEAAPSKHFHDHCQYLHVQYMNNTYMAIVLTAGTYYDAREIKESNNQTFGTCGYPSMA